MSYSNYKLEFGFNQIQWNIGVPSDITVIYARIFIPLQKVLFTKNTPTRWCGIICPLNITRLPQYYIYKDSKTIACDTET